MMIKDVLIGVGIAWLSLTPEGRRVKNMAIKKVMDTYLLPKNSEPEKKEVKHDENAPTA